MITIPKNPSIGDGTFVTYEGTANICTYWEVVEFLDPGEGPALGSLLHGILITDESGRAVNQYVASTDIADIGKIERIKVSEGA